MSSGGLEVSLSIYYIDASKTVAEVFEQQKAQTNLRIRAI